MPIAIAEYTPGDPCLLVNQEDTLQLTASGGTTPYTYAISGQNEISSTGLITAGIFSGEYTVTIGDAAGLLTTVPICIANQAQFCVEADQIACDTNQVEACCEIHVDCNESVNLQIPSFHIRGPHGNSEIRYTSVTGGSTGDAGYLRSGAGAANAVANLLNFSNEDTFFEIITNGDMADTVNGDFGVGFSDTTSGSGSAGMDKAIVWTTNTGTRQIQIEEAGVAVSGSEADVIAGDVVSAGYLGGNFVVYINNVLSYEQTGEQANCKDQYLKVFITTANKSLGGQMSGLTWAITTAGTAASVGSISSTGVYMPPSGGYAGLIQAEASLGNAIFRVNIRNTKPTARYTSPKAFLAGKSVEIWVGPYIANFNEIPRLAKDGSPDALQNPGMINLGVLKGSANFSEQIEYQDFDNDVGTYLTSISKESAQLTATFLEVRDLWKMSQLMTHATLYAKNSGVTEIGVGGKTCSVQELRVIMTIGDSSCDGEMDVLYLPRVQNKGNLGLEVGKSASGEYELSLTALPDYTRPAGRQLYSIYTLDNCSNGACN